MKCRDTAWTSRLMFWYKLWIYKPQIKIWVLLPAGWNRDGCNYLSISTWRNELFPRFGLPKIKRNETQWNKMWGTESLDTRLYLPWYMQELLPDTLELRYDYLNFLIKTKIHYMRYFKVQKRRLIEDLQLAS